jgi:ketosteroid isomerase-like protein
MNAEAEIRRIIDAHAAAVRRGDVDAMLADVDEDILIYDVVEPLRRTGRASVRERAAEWVAAYDGPISWDDRDVAVVAGGDVAFCTMLSRVTGTLRTGSRVDMWLRKTLGLQRRGGRWQITHDHGSVPFNPESGRASLDLKP